MDSTVNIKLHALAVKFADLLKERFAGNLVSVILFGSVARNEAGRYSDIDLLVIFNELPAGHLSRTALVEPIEEALEKDILSLRREGICSSFNYSLKTREEARHIRPLYFDLTMDAVYLYDDDGFFKGVLEGLKSRLKRLGSVRRKVGSVRYWDLKPDFKYGEVFEI